MPIISQHIHICKHHITATHYARENLYIAGSQLSITELYDFWYAVCSRKEILIQGGSNMTGTDFCVNKPHISRSYMNHLVHGNLDLYMFEDYRVPSNLNYCEWCDSLCNNHLATPFAAFLLWPSMMCYSQQ